MRSALSVLLLLGIVARLAAFESRVTLRDLHGSIGVRSVADLELRKKAIEHQLEILAHFAVTPGVGRIGYRSDVHSEKQATEWVQIDLDGDTAIDEIVLVPALWRDARKGLIGDAFPTSFRLTAGSPSGEIELRQVTLPPDFADRVAPFVIQCPGTRARWVRLTASELSPRAFDGRYCMQLSEILVFDQGRNVALGRPVTASSTGVVNSGAWGAAFLTDGFCPYLMDSASGQGSRAFTNVSDFQGQPSITIDLGHPARIDEMILHVIEQNDTVPQAFLGDFGVPRSFVLEGAMDPAFSDPVTLLEYHRSDIFDVSPIMPLRLHPALSRYVRLTATEPYLMKGVDATGRPFTSARLGFAEIELLSNGRNVSTGAPVKLNYSPASPTPFRHAANLTDGKNLYGRILPIRQWLNELALRYDLELELPIVTRELSQRYHRQSELLQRLQKFSAILIIVTIGVVFSTLYYQQRALFRTRQRLAADLHDELGSNLAAVVLLSELAQHQQTAAAQIPALLDRIHALAHRARGAVKYCADILQTPSVYENLPEEMRRMATRMLADVTYTLELPREEDLVCLTQRQRIDLFLFYKECLVNALRHSNATEIAVGMRVAPPADTLELEVRDNGIGMPGGEHPQIPPSVARRARLLRGRLSVLRPAGGGSCIRLSLPLRFRWKALLLRPFYLSRRALRGK